MSFHWRHLLTLLYVVLGIDDVTRFLSNSAYIPRWRKGRTKHVHVSDCSVADCNRSSFALTTITSREGIQGIQFKIEPIPVPTPLCKSHYHRVYNALQA